MRKSELSARFRQENEHRRNRRLGSGFLLYRLQVRLLPVPLQFAGRCAATEGWRIFRSLKSATQVLTCRAISRIVFLSYEPARSGISAYGLTGVGVIVLITFTFLEFGMHSYLLRMISTEQWARAATADETLPSRKRSINR